jgi:hypothetical protein
MAIKTLKSEAQERAFSRGFRNGDQTVAIRLNMNGARPQSGGQIDIRSDVALELGALLTSLASAKGETVTRRLRIVGDRIAKRREER